MNKSILAFAVVLFLVYGCTQAYDFARMESHANIVINYSNFTAPINASCSCMFCTSQIMDKPWYDFWSADVLTYYGANCTIETCTPEIVQAKLQDDVTDIKTYMIGTGTGFADFAFGNTYCKNGMDMAVKWQYDPSGQHIYPLPSYERARCMLENNAIPVYVMYSNGSRTAMTQYSRLKSLAELFSVSNINTEGYGPVIITTEMNSDPEYAEIIANQAYNLKLGCKNCLVAIAPRLGDVETLDKIMEYANSKKIQDINGNLRAPVDMLAVGVDSANYNGSCNPQQLLFAARNFSAYAMYRYNITSIWPYMAVREGTMNTGTEILDCRHFIDEDSCTYGARADFCTWDGFTCGWKTDIPLKYCKWDSGANTRMFSDFFLTEMAASLNDGVIGAAAYSYSGGVNPLNLTGDTGEMDPSTDPNEQVQSTDPRFSHFYGFCAVYANSYTDKDDNVFDNRYRIIVPQDNWNRKIPVYETDAAGNTMIDPGTGLPKPKVEPNPFTGEETPVFIDRAVTLVNCPSAYQNTRFSWLMGVEGADTKYVVGYNPSTGEPILGEQLTSAQYREKSAPGNLQPFLADGLNGWATLPKPWFKCDYCINAIGDAVPGTKDLTGISGSSDYDVWCNAFPQIDSYADFFDIDPWLVRAIMRHETGFGRSTSDPERARCIVAIVAKDDATLLNKYCKTLDASGTTCRYASYTSPVTGREVPIFPGDTGCWSFSHANGVQNLGDPEGVCASVTTSVYIPTDCASEPSLCKAVVTNDPLPDDLAYCAYGLTAVIEHPYYDWSDTHTGGSFTPQQVSEVCGSDFNPLNATDAICWGIYKLKRAWDSSQVTVDAHIKTGDYFGNEAKNDENIRRRYIASLVIEKNRGLSCPGATGNCIDYWISSYNQIKNGNGAGLCNKITYETTIDSNGKTTTTPKVEDVSGQVTDFPNYLATCAPDPLSGTRKYSERILGMYDLLVSSCSRSDCPYGRLSENRKNP